MWKTAPDWKFWQSHRNKCRGKHFSMKFMDSCLLYGTDEEMNEAQNLFLFACGKTKQSAEKRN
jgi:hypothetical protein